MTSLFQDLRHGARMLRTRLSLTWIALLCVVVGVRASAQELELSQAAPKVEKAAACWRP